MYLPRGNSSASLQRLPATTSGTGFTSMRCRPMDEAPAVQQNMRTPSARVLRPSEGAYWPGWSGCWSSSCNRIKKFSGKTSPRGSRSGMTTYMVELMWSHLSTRKALPLGQQGPPLHLRLNFQNPAPPHTAMHLKGRR